MVVDMAREVREARAAGIRALNSLRRAERERAKLLYAVPNVPYREIKEQ